MGTRADFYVGRGAEAEWLGSIAWDGYPDGIDAAILDAKDAETYRTLVHDYIVNEDSTLPAMGWPWPWDDSATTDYAYAFDGGTVYASSFGHSWFEPNLDADDCGEPDDSQKDAVFPDMSSRRNVVLDNSKRSGVIVINGGAA